VGKGFQVGGLSLNPRILTFIIVWILTPRGHNHAVLHEEDLILMFFIINHLKVNWPYVLGVQMEKARRLMDYRIPYVVLVSRLIQYFQVPLEGELMESVKQGLEVSTANLNKVGLVKVNDQWMCQADAENVEGGVVEGAAAMAQSDTIMGEAAPSSNFSKFEQIVIEKLDRLTVE